MDLKFEKRQITKPPRALMRSLIAGSLSSEHAVYREEKERSYDSGECGKLIFPIFLQLLRDYRKLANTNLNRTRFKR